MLFFYGCLCLQVVTIEVFYSSVYLSPLLGPVLYTDMNSICLPVFILINKDYVCIKERVHRPVKTEKITIYLQMVSSNLNGYHWENKLWFSCQKKLHFSIQVMQLLPNSVNFPENTLILAAFIATADNYKETLGHKCQEYVYFSIIRWYIPYMSWPQFS